MTATNRSDCRCSEVSDGTAAGTPAATHEEWSAAYWVELRGTRELRLIGTAGDREHAEETRDDCATEDPTTRFLLARRPVFPWTPTDEK